MKNILLNWQVKWYIHKVAKQLLCSAKTKKSFIAHLNGFIAAFINDSPDCTMDDVLQFSGSPETLAQDFMETLDEKEIERAQRNRQIQKIVIILLIVGFIALLIEIIHILLGINDITYIAEVTLASIPE